MPHPHKRTWTLGDLDRDVMHRLWFDAVAFRWECVPLVLEAGQVLSQETWEVGRVAERADTAQVLRLVPRMPGGQGDQVP